MEIVLMVDVETTGTQTKFDTVIEFAAILYSLTYKTNLASLAFLLPHTENKAEEINNINSKATQQVRELMPMDLVNSMFNMADVIAAHNAEFDRQFIQQLPIHAISQKPWVCTMTDINWPRNMTGKSLISLAAAYNVPVINTHRALTDCKLLCDIFTAEKNITKLLNEALTPKKLYKAIVNFSEKELAKSEGFIWNVARSAWVKKMTDDEAEKVILFKIKEI